jgi:hypothetical protein
VEAYRAVSRRGAQILETGILKALRSGRSYPQEDSWYLFLSEADTTQGTDCYWKGEVDLKLQKPHRE